ncbi:DoxX family protein [Pseudoalteromonas sp. SMS1]|uniref:DoxX family protein n=1 Tax=Pseudoalteromonas sp. SMS1 TaxID=2908894 RepID=UPI001F39612A|nr:DoxX family protein [Pseudoalteromonas sp. SMS1]MCF2859987.1 DoxX family protein [Pseudoalteromonas sp. SMS1]
MKIVNVISNNEGLSNIANLVGRVGLSVIFILAGVNKVQYYEGNAQYLASGGLPEFLLPLVIALELVGGLFILAGAFTQLTALVFAGFCIVSALVFHTNLADQMQFFMFFKNIAMAGGFLVLACAGAGRFSIDHKLVKA